jgi:3' terminal RNA ribose 2'-O-methyltransferase Hen1
MLLTLSTTHRPATDLGYLLHKHPDRFQSFNLSFGKAHVFYPEMSAEGASVNLLLEVDSVSLIRDQNTDPHFLLGQYVNDRPYVASSFLSVAIAQVFSSALQGRCKDRPELTTAPIPLEARLEALSIRGGERFLRSIFEPLEYEVEAIRHPLDERFPEWGDSPYFTIVIRKTTPLSELLTHLYVLIPVFDNRKHYFVGEDELKKLLAQGEGWLATHPAREEITRRYLRFHPSLSRMALNRLLEEATEEEAPENEIDAPTDERPMSLNDQRLMSVVTVLRSSGARRVVDLGCGEGRLLRELLKDRLFEAILGMDVSIRVLEIAHRRLRIEKLPEAKSKRIELIHGSLMYRDPRLQGYDAAAIVEVIEHLDPPRLRAFERVVFEFTRPSLIVLTTPNREYNVVWETLPAGEFRHGDHRFEWSRAEFQTWAEGVALRFGYTVRYLPVGPEHPEHGSPTQMAVFEREAAKEQ